MAFQVLEKVQAKTGKYSVTGVPLELLKEMEVVAAAAKKLGYSIDFSKAAVALFKRTVNKAKKELEAAKGA